MDDARDGQDHKESIGEVVGERKTVVGGEERDLCERHKMAGKQ